MSRYSIQRAQPHHVALLPAIEVAADVLFSEEDLPLEFRGEGTDEADFQGACDAGRLFVAVTDADEPVGFALIEVVDGHAHLEEIDVLPAHGRQGLGKRLVEAVIAWARETNSGPITLTTFRHVPWNAPFYVRMGFVELDARDYTPELQEIVRHEAENGLNPAKRVVMIHTLSS